MATEDTSNEDLREVEIEHYFNLLMDLDMLLYHLREVSGAHEECDGCDLCIDAEGMLYSIKVFFDLLKCGAPAESLKRFRDETDPEYLERAYEEAKRIVAEKEAKAFASAPTPAPMPVPDAELPAAKDRPYWLS